MLESRRVRAAIALSVCAVLFVALCALAPSVALDVRVSYVLAFACVTAEILALSHYAPVESPRVLAMIGAPLVAIAVIAARSVVPVSVVSTLCVMLGLLVFVPIVGRSLGASIQKPGHLLAVGVVSTIADFWSVYDPRGLSARMAEQVADQPDRLAIFALPWPMLGTSRIEPIIGAGDILFSALYLATFEQHGLPVRRAIWALAIGYGLGLVAILVTERPVPLLPLLAVCVLSVDARARSLDAREKRTVGVMLAVLLGVLAVRFLR